MYSYIVLRRINVRCWSTRRRDVDLGANIRSGYSRLLVVLVVLVLVVVAPSFFRVVLFEYLAVVHYRI